MIKVILSVFICFTSLNLFSQKSKAKKEIQWLTPAEAQQRLALEKRPVIIDIYTDWCHYCKVMDNTTWRNSNLIDYVNQYYYPIKFNAESRDTTNWMGVTYEFKPVYKVNMLAAEWLLGNMVYPSTVILPPGGLEPIIIPGVLTVKDLEPMLHYFGEKNYIKKEWANFKANYKPTWN